MANKNLRLPATLIHSVNGKEYTLEGVLMSVNESAGTCTMKFGKYINSNIPLEEVYLNEGLLDKIKETGSKIWGKIKDVIRSIAGLLVPVDDRGNEITSLINMPINLLAMDLPDGVKFLPTAEMLEVASEYGLKIKMQNVTSNAFADAEARDCAEINNYWRRVQQVYVTNESFTVADAVNHVNETYYAHDKIDQVLNEAIVKANGGELNESAVASIYSLNKQLYGRHLGSHELKGKIRDNIMSQISIGDEEEEIDLRKPKSCVPLLIWGAPGVGKSSILNSANEALEEAGIRLSVIPNQCSHLNKDSFSLPDTLYNGAGGKSSTQYPATWLPVYNPASYDDDEELARINTLFNKGVFLKTRADGEYSKAEQNDLISKSSSDGGIILFDEFSRMQPGTSPIFMALVHDRKFGSGYILASNWAIVAASNTLTNDNISECDPDFHNEWVPALSQRFEMYSFAPTKEEWCEWARRKGKGGRQHVEERFVRFVEESKDPRVWYNTLQWGAADFAGSNIKDSLSTLGDNNSKGISDVNTLVQVGDYVSDPESSIERSSFKSSSMRTWEEVVNSNIETALKKRLFLNDLNAFKACYKSVTRQYTGDDGELVKEEVLTLDDKLLGIQLDKVKDSVWNTWKHERQEAVNPSGSITNRLAFFLAWIDNVVIPDAFDDNIQKLWKDHNKVDLVFPEKLIKEIWENGQIKSKKYVDDDNYTFLNDRELYSAKTVYSQWKSNDTTILSVYKKLLEAYPVEEMVKDLLSDLKKLIANKDNKATQADLLKWQKKYSYELIDYAQSTNDNIVLVNNGPIVTLFPEGDPTDQAKKLDVAWLLNNSKVAEKLANAEFWISKVCVQIGPTTLSRNFAIALGVNVTKALKDPSLANLASQYALIGKPDIYAAADAISSSVIENNIGIER